MGAFNCLLPLALLLVLHTHNNTDGNKLMIFSGIASYYGDNYMWSGGMRTGVCGLGHVDWGYVDWAQD